LTSANSIRKKIGHSISSTSLFQTCGLKFVNSVCVLLTKSVHHLPNAIYQKKSFSSCLSQELLMKSTIKIKVTNILRTAFYSIFFQQKLKIQTVRREKLLKTIRHMKKLEIKCWQDSQWSHFHQSALCPAFMHPIALLLNFYFITYLNSTSRMSLRLAKLLHSMPRISKTWVKSAQKLLIKWWWN